MRHIISTFSVGVIFWKNMYLFKANILLFDLVFDFGVDLEVRNHSLKFLEDNVHLSVRKDVLVQI